MAEDWIIPYTSGDPRRDTISELMNKGVLKYPPRQVPREDLLWDDGIDIIYELDNMTPRKFRDYADMLVQAAAQEGTAYDHFKYMHARFDVDIYPRSGDAEPLIRSYMAPKHTDPKIVAYGLGEESEEKIGLWDQAVKVLDIPNSPSGKDAEGNALPFRIVRMVISIRVGMKDLIGRIQAEKQTKRTMEEIQKPPEERWKEEREKM